MEKVLLQKQLTPEQQEEIIQNYDMLMKHLESKVAALQAINEEVKRYVGRQRSGEELSQDEIAQVHVYRHLFSLLSVS